jgi:CubicO group peptidase (beta-lactamase class C family)
LPIESQSPEAQANAYFANVLKMGVPGMAGAVAVNGKIVFSVTAGIADRDTDARVIPSTVFNIGSVSKDDPLLFTPGALYFYSSYGVNLLQGVIEKVGGLPFEEYMSRNVWVPSGMVNTRFDISEQPIPNRAKAYQVSAGGRQAWANDFEPRVCRGRDALHCRGPRTLVWGPPGEETTVQRRWSGSRFETGLALAPCRPAHQH